MADFFNVDFEDNYTFDATNLRYRLMTPNTPARLFSFNLGTKKADQLSIEHYQNFNKPQNVQCEKIQVKMRDGYEVPLVMAYDKQYFNEKSPWVMFTRGAQSEKADL